MGPADGAEGKEKTGESESESESESDLDLDLDLDLISTDKRETARSRPSREGNHGAPSGRRQGL